MKIIILELTFTIKFTVFIPYSKKHTLQVMILDGNPLAATFAELDTFVIGETDNNIDNFALPLKFMEWHIDWDDFNGFYPNYDAHM